MESEDRKILKALVLELRHLLEGWYDSTGQWHAGDLEQRLNALGVWRDRAPLPADEISYVSAADREARKVVDAYIQLRREAGIDISDAVAEFVRETAYTWSNRLLALRCMESRELIDEAILQKDVYGGRSLEHHRLVQRHPELCSGEDDGLLAMLESVFSKQSEQLSLLFDPKAPGVALRPSVAALKQCISLLSGTEATSGQDAATDDIFRSPDSLGWAYQYWNSEEKDQVFERVRTKKAKIEGADIIPATQLYTEPYMVKFLVQNSLGAMWMGMYPESRLFEEWEYYVSNADRAPVERRRVAEITVLDPAVGSGHFLLEAFDLLYDMYLEEGEIKGPASICESILQSNLFGIDIDERSVQIAEAVLWMRAAEKAFDFRGVSMNLVPTNICLPKGKDHLEAFLNDYPEDTSLGPALETVFEALEHADELGSLIQIEEPVEKELRYLKQKYEELRTLGGVQADFFQKTQIQGKLPIGVESYDQWKTETLDRLKAHFATEAISTNSAQSFFSRSAARGLDLLSKRYDVVTANPPYMGSKNMGTVLKKHLEIHYPSGKRDLYAAFILRCRQLNRPGGRIAMVTQHSWMFLRSFTDLRLMSKEVQKPRVDSFRGLLEDMTLETLAHLGSGAFDEISGWIVNIVTFVIANTPPEPRHRLTAFRLIGPRNPNEKDRLLKLCLSNGVVSDVVYHVMQSRFIKVPTGPIMYWVSDKFMELASSATTIRDVAEVKQGIVTGNNNKYLRSFWEVPQENFLRDWTVYAKGGGYSKWCGMEELCIKWEWAKPQIAMTSIGRTRDWTFFGKLGWTYSLVSSGSISVRELKPEWKYDNIALAVFPNEITFEALGSFLNSHLASYLLRQLCQSVTFNGCYVEALPAYQGGTEVTKTLVKACQEIKHHLASRKLNEVRFLPELRKHESLAILNRSNEDSSMRCAAILHTLEYYNECLVHEAFDLETDEADMIYRETGVPVGRYPMIDGYAKMPNLPDPIKIPDELSVFISSHRRVILSSQDLLDLRQNLQNLYEAGPSWSRGKNTRSQEDENEDEGSLMIGAYMPVPAETFLEELSQELRIHPISC